MAHKKVKPTSILPFKLHNIKDFVTHGKRPYLSPLLPEYMTYWVEEVSKCILGTWGHDYNKETKEGGYRWMPGNLYFYINMTIIKLEGEFGSELTQHPMLRDVEWKIFYSLIACDGFSGFEFDEEFTCYRPVQKLELLNDGKTEWSDGRKIVLKNREKRVLDKYDKELKKPDGTYKKYIPAMDYLYKTWDKPMGSPLFMNECLNLILLSTRRLGKSYSINGGVILYDFVFNGARTVDQYLNKETTSTTVVGSADSKYTKELLDKFLTTYEYLRTDVGSFTDAAGKEYSGCFWTPFDGSLASGKSITNRVKLKGGKGFRGAGSKVVNVSYADNPNAGVGYASKRNIVEEAGLLDKFEDVHSENGAAQKRETKFGYSIYIGTGGNIEKIKGIREAFNNPDAYECLSFEDTFSGSNSKIGLFFPSYYIKNDFRDENGNTDVQGAFEDENTEREDKKVISSSAYQKKVISFPFIPDEMFMNNSGNIFPLDKLEAVESYLKTNQNWEREVNLGDLVYIDKSKSTVQWKPLTDKTRKYIKGYGDEKDRTLDDLKGALAVYEFPMKDKPAATFKDPLYIIVYDPVRDEGEGSSLAAIMVFKMWFLEDLTTVQFNVVAEWYGRHLLMEDNHEIAFKLARFYNAKIFPEVNNEDIKRYARMTNRFEMLEPRPGLALDGAEMKQKKDYQVGLYVSPSKGFISKLDTYLNELLHVIVKKEDKITSFGKFESTKVMMVDEMKSLRFVQELIYYGEGNFDAVSCGRLLGIWARQQDLKPKEYKNEDESRKRDKDFLDFINKSSAKSKQKHPAFNY